MCTLSCEWQVCCLSWISVRLLFSFFRCVRSLLKNLYVAILTNGMLFCLRFSSFCLCQLRQPAAGKAHNDDTKNWQLSSSPRGRKKPGFGFHLQSQERRVDGEKLCPCYFPKNAMMQAEYWFFFFYFQFIYVWESLYSALWTLPRGCLAFWTWMYQSIFIAVLFIIFRFILIYVRHSVKQMHTCFDIWQPK